MRRYGRRRRAGGERIRRRLGPGSSRAEIARRDVYRLFRSTIWLAHINDDGYYGFLKTTLDIQDALLERAKRHAKRIRRPLRAIVEEGLRRVLAERSTPEAYTLPDASVGDPGAADPLETLSWQDLRREIYGEPPSR